MSDAELDARIAELADKVEAHLAKLEEQRQKERDGK